MTTAYTSLLGLALPVTGELSGTWGNTVNTEITALLDSAVAGTTTISADADITLTTTTGAANESREAIILWTAGGTVTRNITAPAQSKAYIVINKSSNTQSIVLRGVGPTTGVTIVLNEKAVCAWNGSDFVKVASTVITNLTGTLPVVNGGTGVTTSTGSGNVVLSTSPTITTPVISQLSSASATALTLQSAGTTAITVDTSQNVGVGGTTPASNPKLSLYGGIRFVSTETAAATYTGIGSLVADNVSISTAGTECMRINSSGNVGIGTASPAYKLDVTGQGRATTGFAVSTDGSTFTPSGLNAIPNYGVGYITSTSQVALSGFGGIPFYTNATEAMRIDGSGNVIIGNTAQFGSGKFNIKYTPGTTTGVSFLPTTDASTPTPCNFLNAAATSVGTIVTSASATAYNTSSDYRLKETIAPMTGALAKVAALKPVTYKWKVDGADAEGFIAHELAEVCPNAVTGAKDAVDADGNPQYQGIDTSFLVATLTAAIQELTARVAALETN